MAQPPLTSGFGSVLELEHELQAATRETIAGVEGEHAVAIARVLHQQARRLDGNIALLGQRYEMLPHPARFQALQRERAPDAPVGTRWTDPPADRLGGLDALVVLHDGLIENIRRLTAKRPDGQRGALILAEVSRRHEAMVSVLAALIQGDDAPQARDAAIAAERVLPERERDWENEGGRGLQG